MSGVLCLGVRAKGSLETGHSCHTSGLVGSMPKTRGPVLGVLVVKWGSYIGV